MEDPSPFSGGSSNQPKALKGTNSEQKPERSELEKRCDAVSRITKGNIKDHYEILGLKKDGANSATFEEVTKAYRDLAKLVHPDKCNDQDNKELKASFVAAYQRIQDACKELGGNIKLGDGFHPSYVEEGSDDGSPDLPRPEESLPPPPDEFHKTIYAKATPDMLKLIENPGDAASKSAIDKLNEEIKTHNKTIKKPEADCLIILQSLLPTYAQSAKLHKNPDTRGSRANLQEINGLLKELNERYGYPSTWTAEVPSDWPHDGAQLSLRGQGAAADAELSQRGQGAAAAPVDPDPSFQGVRTRDKEPILAYRKIGKDGRQYLVQTGSPENPAFEFRSQAGDDGVGRKVGRAYESSPGAVLLGEADKRFTKEDADRYVGITGVAYKRVQVGSADCRDRYPTTSARMVFKNPDESVWLWRTTTRRVAGKRDADLDIHDWSTSRGFVPSDKVPPIHYLIKSEAHSDAFPRRAIEGIKAENRAAITGIKAENRMTPEKEIKAEREIKLLTDGQDDLHTRLAKLEKDFKDEQKKTADQLERMETKSDDQFAKVMAKLAELTVKISGSS